MAEMTEERIAQYHMEGFGCAQVVLGYAIEEYGLDIDLETAYRIASGFEAGMWAGKRCGAVTGAIMALGLMYGYGKPYETAAKEERIEKMKEFEERFLEAYDTTDCKEMLQCDLSVPEEMQRAVMEGLLEKVCPGAMMKACEILDDLA